MIDRPTAWGERETEFSSNRDEASDAATSTLPSPAPDVAIRRGLIAIATCRFRGRHLRYEQALARNHLMQIMRSRRPMATWKWAGVLALRRWGWPCRSGARPPPPSRGR